jgi:MFS family permease
MTLGPTVSIEHYGTRAVYGIVVAAMGAGTVAGALIGFRWQPRYPMRLGMLLCLPFPIAVGLFAVGAPVGVLVVLFVLTGGGLALFGIWWDTALAQRIPPQTLSRVSAYDWMGSLALLPIGYVLAGPLGEALGAVEVLAVGSALGFAVFAASLAVAGVWRLERLSREA